jgi:hypothetical protein
MRVFDPPSGKLAVDFREHPSDRLHDRDEVLRAVSVQIPY